MRNKICKKKAAAGIIQIIMMAPCVKPKIITF